MKLYNYFRSSASYRVRIALNLKGLEFEYLPIHLVKGEQLTDAFRSKSPDGLVPVLVDGQTELTQSLAICEYLEELHPLPPLLPKEPAARAHVRGLALSIACEIHPLNNLRVLRYLAKELDIAEDKRERWYRHWVERGLSAFEERLRDLGCAGRYCFGDDPGLADICLVPQIFNAQRLNADLSGVPRLLEIHATCMAHPAFAIAEPSRQPDAT